MCACAEALPYDQVSLLQGPLKFYTGFPTYCVRIAPHVTLTLVFLDALKKAQANAGL